MTLSNENHHGATGLLGNIARGKASSYEALMNSVIDLTNLLDQRVEEKPVIENLIYQGDLVLMAGAEKERKSTLCLQCLCCLACGKDFIGFRINDPIQVMYIDAESKRHVLLDRLSGIKACLTMDEWELVQKNLRLIDGRNLTKEGLNLDIFQSDVERIITEFQGAKVIVLDSLRLFFPHDENNSQHIARLISRLRVILDDQVLILVHHTRKRPNNKDSRVSLREDPSYWSDNIRGSNAFKAHADAIFMQEIRQHAQVGEILDFAAILRASADVRPMPLCSSEESFSWHQRMAEQDQSFAISQLNNSDREILHSIRGLLAEREFTIQELMKKILPASGKSRSQTYKIVQKLLQQGFLAETQNGDINILC